MRGALGGDDGDPGAPTINTKNVDGGSPRKRCRRSKSAHHQHKKTSMAGSLGGDAGDPRTPTINAKNIDSGSPDPHGGSDLHPRSERCVVNLQGYDK
jgi:hypothetical protein